MKSALTILLFIPILLSSQKNGFEINFNSGVATESIIELDNILDIGRPNFDISLSYHFGRLGFGIDYVDFNYLKERPELSNFNPSIFDIGGNFRNDFKLLTIGPILSLGKGKFQIELSPKIAYGNIERSSVLGFFKENETSVPFNVYRTNEADASQLLASFSSKFNLQISERVGINLNANYFTDQFFNAEIEVTTYTQPRDFNNDGVFSQEEIISSPIFEKNRGFLNPLYTSIGITILFPKNKKSKPKENTNDLIVMPPITIYPENGSSLSLSKADSIIFEWKPESKKLKGANYDLTVFKIIDEKDSLVFSTKIKNETQFNHGDEPALEYGNYRWIVQAIDAKGIEYCQTDCFSDEAEFAVGGLIIPQYYHLLTRDAGNYLEQNNKLRFLIEPAVLYDETVSAEILNASGDVVFNINNILKENESLIKAGGDKYEIDIRNLKPESYYLFKIKNSHRVFYLRFFKTNKEDNESNK